MQLSVQHKIKRRSERGNALLYVFIAIAVLALLTFALSDTSDDTENIADYAAADEQISRMLSYSGTLAATLNQMVLAGADAPTLYTSLSVLAPADAGYATAPHNLKLFHPMGGGMNYINSTGPVGSSDTVATDFKINKDAIVEGIGPTDATVGDILFTALVTSAKACKRINFLLLGNPTIPAEKTAIFNDLFHAGGAQTLGTTGNCTECIGRPQYCISNGAGTEWGYYMTMFPG